MIDTVLFGDLIYILAVVICNYIVVKKTILKVAKYKWLIGLATTIVFNIVIFFVSIVWWVMINLDGTPYPEYKVYFFLFMGPLNLLATLLAIVISSAELPSTKIKEENKE